MKTKADSHPLQQPPRRAQNRENPNRPQNPRPDLIRNTFRVYRSRNTKPRTNDADYTEGC